MAVRAIQPRVGAARILPKDGLGPFVNELATWGKVFAPVGSGQGYAFSPVTDAGEVCLDYPTTMLPPKKLLHRPKQELFRFGPRGVATCCDTEKTVLLGAHPCDVNAILSLDRIYRGGEYPDPHYSSARDGMLIVAVNCTRFGEHCFCDSLGTGPDLASGYDIVLTDIGSGYLAEPGTLDGEKILGRCRLDRASVADTLASQRVISRARASDAKRAWDTAEIRRHLADDEAWERLADDCLGCGTCTMVCPTCFCYSVADQVDLSLTEGSRSRTWDSCLFSGFSAVAQGHNFRPERAERLRERMRHKFAHQSEQSGLTGCVGCGRCAQACVRGLGPAEIARRLREEDDGRD